MDFIYFFILVPMVYIAFAVFIIGIIIRLITIFKKPPNPITLQIFPEKHPKWLRALYDTFFLPTVRKHNPSLWIFLIIFHISFILLLLGHFELIRDFSIIQIIKHDVFLGKGFLGLIISLCLLFFIFRRFVSPYRELSIPEDYYLLILLFLTALFGSQMDWARHLGYDTIGVQEYRQYLSGLIVFRSELPVVSDSGHSFMLILHVFFANLFLIFFPFSKIMHSFFALPMNKLRRG